MKFKQWAVVLTCSTAFWGSSMSSALGQGISTTLSGYQEVPAVSTTGTGTFFLSNTLQYELSYDLEGEVIQAHLHFGQAGTNGGIMIWLCANPDFIPSAIDPPLDTPECEGSTGAVSSVLTAFDVVGPSTQGIESGEGFEALNALLAGVTYVNVHSTRFPSGEVRAQIRFGRKVDSIEELREELDELREDFEDHSHTYLTGRGQGHNNTEATTGPPEF